MTPSLSAAVEIWDRRAHDITNIASVRRSSSGLRG